MEDIFPDQLIQQPGTNLQSKKLCKLKIGPQGQVGKCAPPAQRAPTTHQELCHGHTLLEFQYSSALDIPTAITPETNPQVTRSALPFNGINGKGGAKLAERCDGSRSTTVVPRAVVCAIVWRASNHKILCDLKRGSLAWANATSARVKAIVLSCLHWSGELVDWSGLLIA